ncbi:MAG: hypothetical protein ACOZF0_24070 [Thermodesulfobacteriota bacterium]
MTNQDKLRFTMAEWLAKYPWTHWAHLRFNHDRISGEQAEKCLKGWRLKLIKRERLQVATFGIINHRPTSHLHILLMGINRQGKTLDDVEDGNWKVYARLWPGSAVIDPIKDKGAIEYMAFANTPAGHYELLMPYNTKLLARSFSKAPVIH